MIDSPDLVAILIVFGLMMLAAGLLGFMAASLRSDHANEGIQSWDRYSFDDIDDLPTSEEEQETPALPVDVANPPVSRVYNPRPGSNQKYCWCHDRALEPGEEVLWWPIPASEGGGVRLVCKDGVAGAQV